MNIELRDYQQNALQCIERYFKKNGNKKALIKMFCGTGKTHIFSQWLLSLCNIQIIVFPSLLLIEQYVRDYLVTNDSDHYEFFAFCSDIKTTSKNVIYTTDVHLLKNNTHKSILVTYDSFPVLFDYFKSESIQIDKLVFDEAHHINSGSILEIIHCPEFNSLVNQCLCFTATPVGDKNIYGPCIFEYNGYQAIKDNICKTFDVGIILCQQKIEEDLSEEKRIIKIVLQSIFREQSYDYFNCLIYLRNVNYSCHSMFVNGFITDEMKAFAQEEFHKLKNEFQDSVLTELVFEGVSANSLNKKEIVEQFNIIQHGRVMILFSCGILNEGIDTKTANYSVIMDPSKSIVQNTQRIGRIMRKSDEMYASKLLIPIYIDHKENIDILQTLCDGNNYGGLLGVFASIKHNVLIDEQFIQLLKTTSITIDKKPESSVVKGKGKQKYIQNEQATINIHFALEDLEWTVKQTSEFQNNLCNAILKCNKNNAGAIWKEKLKELSNFLTDNKRLPKSINQERFIYQWFIYQKQKFRCKQLSEEQTSDLLNLQHAYPELSITTDTFEERFEELRNFITKNKRVPVTRDKIYRWFIRQRNRYNKDELSKTEQESFKILESEFPQLWVNERKSVEPFEKTFRERFQIFENFIKMNMRLPMRKDKELKIIYNWHQNCKKKYNKQVLTNEQKAAFVDLQKEFPDLHILDKKYSNYEENFKKLEKYLEEFKSVPKEKDQFYGWFLKYRKQYWNGTLSNKEKNDFLNLQNKFPAINIFESNIKTFEYRLKELEMFIETNKRVPTWLVDTERQLYDWFRHTKNKLKNNDLLKEQAKDILQLPKKFPGIIIDLEVKAKTFNFEEKIDELRISLQSNGKLSSTNLKWLYKKKITFINGKLSEQQRSSMVELQNQFPKFPITTLSTRNKSFEERYEELKDFIREKQRLPRSINEEKSLYEWLIRKMNMSSEIPENESKLLELIKDEYPDMFRYMKRQKK